MSGIPRPGTGLDPFLVSGHDEANDVVRVIGKPLNMYFELRVESARNQGRRLAAFANRHENAIEILFVLAAVAVVTAVPVYHDITRPFWANGDPDADLAYMALVFNAGRPIPFNNFTGYGYVLLLGPFLTVAEWLGFIEASTIEPFITTTRFESLFGQVISAGRVFSILLAVMSTLTMWWVLRLATGNRLVSGLGTLLIATSLGMMAQFVLMRPEMMSMLFVLLSVGAMLVATRRTGWRTVAALSAAAFLALYAAMVKVQAILIILPLVVLPFLFAWPRVDRAGKAPEARHLWLFGAVAVVFSVPALGMIAEAFSLRTTWTYQALIVAYLGICVAAYGAFVMRSVWWSFAVAGGILIGVSAAFYLVLIHDHWWTPFALVNFVDFMSYEARADASPGSWSFGALFASVIDGFARHTGRIFFEYRLDNKDYWMQIIYWGAVILLVAGLWLRQWGTVLRSAFFIGLAVALPAIFSIRDYHYYYQFYVEPWAILAAGIIGASVLNAAGRKWIVTGLMVVSVVAVSTVNLRYRLIAPSTATTRNLTHLCCYLGYAKLITDHLRPYCERGIAEYGGISAVCPQGSFDARIKKFLKR